VYVGLLVPLLEEPDDRAAGARVSPVAEVEVLRDPEEAGERVRGDPDDPRGAGTSRTSAGTLGSRAGHW
jgi:hypothetical protein